MKIEAPRIVITKAERARRAASTTEARAKNSAAQKAAWADPVKRKARLVGKADPEVRKFFKDGLRHPGRGAGRFGKNLNTPETD